MIKALCLPARLFPLCVNDGWHFFHKTVSLTNTPLLSVLQVPWLKHQCTLLVLSQSWTTLSHWPVGQQEQLSQLPGCTTGPHCTLTGHESFPWTTQPSLLVLSCCLTMGTIHARLQTPSVALAVNASCWTLSVSIWKTSFKLHFIN